jgi:hypothetical protein
MIRLGLFINSMSAKNSFTIPCMSHELSSMSANLRILRRPRLSPSVEADNLEIKRIIGHPFRQQGGLQFLCHWKDYAAEDSTYRNADAIVHPVARALVAGYIRSLSSIQQDLGDWISENPWALGMGLDNLSVTRHP